MLAEVTPVLGDDRAYVAVEQLARDGSAPPRQRLAALQALAAYAVPGTILAYRNLDRPGLPVQGYVMLGTSHEERRAADCRNSARAHQALLDVAHAEPESLVKTIAAYIARRVTMSKHIDSPYTE